MCCGVVCFGVCCGVMIGVCVLDDVVDVCGIV